MNLRNENGHVPKLALRPRDAALAIGISERTLWDLTHRQNEIPYVQIGKSIRYRVTSLEAYLAAHEKKVDAVASVDPISTSLSPLNEKESR